MATTNLGFGSALDPNALANFVQNGDAVSTPAAGGFDMSGPGWQNLLMGMALLDAGRRRPINQQQPLMTTLAPIMQMQAQQGNQKRAMDFMAQVMKDAPAIPGMDTGGAASAPAAPSAPGAPGGLLAQPNAASVAPQQSGASRISDPRGVVPLITATAQKYGIDPAVAVKVAQSEGLGTFYGDGGKSGGAFQLYTGGGLGNEFQKDTGLNPLDPKNEPATIDYALSQAAKNGWGPWHGAKRVGIGQWDGINATGDNLAAVPNFAGMMTGNQGAAYAPSSSVSANSAQAAPIRFAQATPQTMTDAGPQTAGNAQPQMQSPLLVGDSIAGHMITFGGGAGATDRNTVGKYKPGLTAVNGFTPSQILDTVIPGIPDAQIRGRNVVLSTGASNDPTQLDVIPKQIAALKQRGATGVTLAGVGTAPQLQGVNDTLAQIASTTGANFAGPLRNVGQDGIHSSDPGAELAAVQSAIPRTQPQMQPNPFASQPGAQPQAAPAMPQMPAAGQMPTPLQAAQGRALMPQTPPPPSPDNVSGATTQRALAIRNLQYWTRATIAAGFLGDAGKGIMEAAKANIDLASKFVTPTDLQKNIAGLPQSMQQQFLINNLDKRPEAQRNANFAYPGNPAVQQQVVGNSITDNSPAHAGQIELAKRMAGLQVLPQEEAYKARAEYLKPGADIGLQSDLEAAKARAKMLNTPINIRQGGSAWQVMPDGTTRMMAQSPILAPGVQLGPNGEAQQVPGALSAIEQSSRAHAAGPAAFEPQEFHGLYGQEFQGTRRQLPQVGAIGAAQPATAPSAPGSNSLSVGGAITPVSPASVGSPSAAPPQRPEAAAPTFPVNTASGPKDISQITVGDMFPGGQGIPQPPAPPPGLGYGKPDAATVDMQKQDVERLNGYNKESAENQKIYQDVSHLHDVLGQSLNTNNLAPFWTDLTNIAHGLGADNLIPKQYDPSNAAEFNKAATDLVFAAVKKMAGQVKVAEIQGYQQANPGITIPRETNYNIMNDVLANSKWQDARARLANEYWTTTGHAPLAAFDTKFNAMAPLTDVTDAYKQAIRQADPNAKFPGEGTNAETAQPAASPPTALKRVFTRDDYGKLAPGQQYVDPQGKIRIKNQ